ncbi:NADH:flavin oxidoreductase/NADH oxidase [Sulfurospirillum oryzae]|uniref:NADH:flavin oxidoreductase/NADH oxidase n=1 Tax=Sulfurospirillum oryzae TaxID=2976535 RepID=UPI0021E6F92A|nr:NADH:flavin oxidoreductase/NADH oxidase [Sulfurospirillum oryzae]
MSLLLSPYEQGKIHLKNKVVMPPMCMYKAKEDGEVTPFHLTHYTARAIGGVGLIIVEATAVEPRGRISDNDIGLWDDAHIEGHQKLVTLAHSYGTKMAVQLAHAGRKSICKETTPVAPSPLLFSETGGYKRPHELSLEEIAEIKTHFVEAAGRAHQAGYDMLELHAAHGYLLCEFLSPLTNQRCDRYGGSLENRCALVVEIAEAIVHATPLPLIVRISADEWMSEGWNVTDSIKLSKALQNVGVTIIHVSAGGNHEKQTHIPSIVPLYQAGYAKTIRENVGIPTIAVGLITTAKEGEKLLKEGFCDLVAYGRELLRNPNFIYYAAKEQGLKELIEVSYSRAF